MKVYFAEFHISHRETCYRVAMRVQHVAENKTSTVVEITDPLGLVLKQFSSAGRQVLSPYNARKFLREALVDLGRIKPRAAKKTPPATGKPELWQKAASRQDRKPGRIFSILRRMAG